MEEEGGGGDEGPVVVSTRFGECHIIGAIGHDESGRAMYKVKFESGIHAGRFMSITYVKESDSEKLMLEASNCQISRDWTYLDPFLSLHIPFLSPLSWEYTPEGYYCVLFNYMKPVPLLAFMSLRFRRGLPERFMLYVLFTILRAVWSIHDKRKYYDIPFHGRISAAHIYLDQINQLNNWFLVVLGYPTSLFDHHRITSPSFYSFSAAPEVYGRDDDATTYGAEADIWLVGITALELAYGGLGLGSCRDDLENLITNMHRMRKLPNKFNTEEGHLYWEETGCSSSMFTLLSSCIGRSKHKIVPTGYEYMPDEWVFSKKFVCFVLACLDLDPTKRPTAMELLQYQVFDPVRDEKFFEM